MTPAYDMRDPSTRVLHATEYPLKGEVRHIFAVPERCSVGTNSLRNSITVLDTSAPQVKYRTAYRAFTWDVAAGSNVFLPEFSNDTIGYAKTRSFVLVNIKNSDAQRFKLAPIVQFTIDDIAVIDWSRRLFVVSLNFTQTTGTETELQVVDLSGPDVKILADLEIKKDPRWARLGRTTFYLSPEGDGLRLHALDEHLQETFHPLLAPYNRRLFAGEPDLPLLHPTLPFAVFGTLEPAPGLRLMFRLATWREGPDKPEVVTIAESESGPFRFSPDGRWLLFLDRSLGPKRLVVMPVDPALPHYLGPPLLLGTSEKIEELGNNCAWISDPPSVVCTINRTERIEPTGEDRPINKLLKWELPSRKK